jgi:DNA-binding beta-propeller fold protein YncE
LLAVSLLFQPVFRNLFRMLRHLFLILATLPAFAYADISTVAGTGVKGFSGDNGPAQKAQLNNPYGLTRGPDGALYICDVDNHCIRRIALDNTITTIAGTPGKKGYNGDNGPATAAMLNEPYELRFDKAGNLFVVERMNHVIRKIDMKTTVITTLAGTGKPGFAGDDGPAERAQFNQPHSIQFDPAGDLYVCDILNHRIRRIDSKTHQITTWAGTGEKKPTLDGAPLKGTPLFGPRALEFDTAGNAYLALREGNQIFTIDAKTQTLHLLAGTGKKGSTGNGGSAKDATLSGPKGLALSADSHRLYLADTESHTIRVIDLTTGTIAQVAGTTQKADGPDGDPLKCPLSRPHGVFVAPDATLYIGDSENHRVRMIPHP